jgi:hypothetical protein
MSRSIPTVGPRHLPADGWARVWIDTGSGPGCEQYVRCDRLTLAEIDDGEGDSAIYDLHLPAAEVADAAII